MRSCPAGEAARLLGAPSTPRPRPPDGQAAPGEQGRPRDEARGRGRAGPPDRRLGGPRSAVAGGSPHSGHLLDGWLDQVAEHLAAKTVHEYRRLARARIRPALGDKAIRTVSPSDVDRFYRALSCDAGLSPASVRHVHAVLSQAFGQAVKWGWIPESPIGRTTPPPVRRAEVKPPSPEAVMDLIAAAVEHDPDFGLLVLLAATTGARRGELCAMRWADVDLEAGALTVRRAMTDVGGRVSEKDTKTHAARRLRLDALTIEALRAHRVVVEERATLCETEVKPAAFVCSHAADGATGIRPDKVTSTFVALRDRLGLPGVRLHDLRHFMATAALAAGVPVRTISGRLGHASASTTLGVYAHFVEARDQDAADALGSLLRPAEPLRS